MASYRAPSVAVAAAAGAAGFSLCALWWRTRRRSLAAPESSSPLVVVLCAVREEMVHVEAQLSQPTTIPPIRLGTRALRRVRGHVGAAVVEVVCCGIGLVDAAAAMTAILLRRGVDDPARVSAVLSVGCSGAHAADIHAGDVVVGAAAVPTACKMLRADGSSEHVGLRLDTTNAPVREIAADERLVEIAVRDAATIDLPAWPTTPDRRPAIHAGKVASTDTWSQCPKDIGWHNTELGTLCEEMESFAVARMCTAFGVPWLGVKDVVNNELHGGGPDEEETKVEDDDDDPSQQEGASGSSVASVRSKASAAEETGLGESLILHQLGRRAALVAVAVIRALDERRVCL